LESTNFKNLALQDYANMGEPKKLVWVVQSGSRRIDRVVAQAKMTCNEALMYHDDKTCGERTSLF